MLVVVALCAVVLKSMTGFVGTVPTLRSTSKQTSVRAEDSGLAKILEGKWDKLEEFPNWRAMVDVTNQQVRDVVEIFFTLPGQGARCQGGNRHCVCVRRR